WVPAGLSPDGTLRAVPPVCGERGGTMKGCWKCLLAGLLAGCLSIGVGGCSPKEQEAQEEGASSGPLEIVTTIVPVYEWVQAILGENPAGAEVTLLIDSGVDPHSFQPSAADLLKVHTCDFLVYVGGESDQWLLDALEDPAQ